MSIDTERQLWESPTSKTGRRYAGKEASVAGTLFLEEPLCPSTQTFTLKFTPLPSGDIQEPNGDCLWNAGPCKEPGPWTELHVWALCEETRLEITKLSHYLLGKRPIQVFKCATHQAGK